MSVDELRTGLARIAASVVPDEDPYDRLMRHARRRRRRRFAGFGAVVAAVLAAALAGPAAFSAAGLDGRSDESRVIHGRPVDSPWTWRLINSPTRGSLAGDRELLAAVTRLFDRERDEVLIAADLPTVKVLYADESAGFRHVVVVYHSATSAALVTREGPVGASPRQLLRGDGEGNDRVTPFTVVGATSGMPGEQKQWLLGLAPAGCTVSYARSAHKVFGGGVHRRWERVPTGEYLLLDEMFVRGWWRVECDGQVRQQEPIGYRHDALGNGDAAPADPFDGRPSPAPVTPDWRLTRDAAASYRTLTDLSGLVGAAKPVIRWAGRLDVDGGTDAVLLAAPGDGPTMLQVGAGDLGPLLALAPPGEARPDEPGTPATGRAQVSLVSTGIPVAYDLAVVRVPDRDGGRAVLTDRLLAVPRREAVRVEAVADGRVRATAPVRGGAALLTLPIGAEMTLRALDAHGKVVGSGALREPATGERIFNEPLISHW